MWKLRGDGRGRWSWGGALAGAILGVGCAGPQTAGERTSDAWISAQVEAKLTADPQTNPFEIDVDTEDGVVTLRGIVNEEADRREAAELARTVQGVQRVENRLEVGETSMRQSASDASITAEVKSKLVRDPEVSGLSIDVDTTGGTVTLSGYVETEDARREAERLARSVGGVRDVRNELQVNERQ